MPSNKTYINHFGSFKNALIKAELFNLRDDKFQFCKTYTDDELLDSLKDYMKNKERIPVHSILKNDLKDPTISTYENRFYSIFNALKMIGYDLEKQKEKDLIELENDMINKYKKLKEIIGKVPNSRDIDRFKKNKYGYGMTTYINHFGSLYELQKICGFIATEAGRNKSRDDLIVDLKELYEELGRTPGRNELIKYKHMASYSTYSLVFGSWTDAIKVAGLTPNDISSIYYSIKGTKCLSYYELKFTNMLESKRIKFTKENRYNEFINTDKNFRFDFIIYFNNQQYFIEVFGITNNEYYNKKIKEKIKLCVENGINLIELYPNDLLTNDLNEIYYILLNKINNK